MHSHTCKLTLGHSRPPYVYIVLKTMTRTVREILTSCEPRYKAVLIIFAGITQRERSSEVGSEKTTSLNQTSSIGRYPGEHADIHQRSGAGMDNPFNSITLSQLYNFHVLSRTLHFTEAARELYITQPTLSASIKALETELDTPLLIREGRRNVRLTKQGKELDEKLGTILRSLDEALDETRKKGSSADSTLNLGTIPTIQYDFLPALLTEYWRIHSCETKIRISVEFSLPLLKRLRQQNYDAIFAAFRPR